MTWTPLGEGAWTVDPAPIGAAEGLMADAPRWLREAWACGDRLALVLAEEIPRSEVERAILAAGERTTPRTIEIPTIYDGPDLAAAAEALGLTVERFVALHAGESYTCAAVGFCPGFGYLETLPVEIGGLPRLPSPRPRVPAGSVAIAGNRTAVYPLDRPGGWRLIGRTELPMVDVGAGLFRLRVGDRVRFVPQGIRA